MPALRALVLLPPPLRHLRAPHPYPRHRRDPPVSRGPHRPPRMVGGSPPEDPARGAFHGDPPRPVGGGSECPFPDGGKEGGVLRLLHLVDGPLHGLLRH